MGHGESATAASAEGKYSLCLPRMPMSPSHPVDFITLPLF